MGSLPQQLGRSNELPKPRRRSVDHSDTTKQNPKKGFLKDNPKHLKRNPLKSTKKPSDTYSYPSPSTFDSYNAERRRMFEEYSANGGNTTSRELEFVPKQRRYEDENKYVDQALAIIQFTLQEANNLEQVIRMSKKLSSDSVYVREVMSRLRVQLEKIETVNNRKIMEKKNEGILFIQAKIVELVRQAEDIKRTVLRDSRNTYTHKREEKYHATINIASKFWNTEQVASRKKLRHESNNSLQLTTIAEDLEREEISDERTTEVTEGMGSKANLSIFDFDQHFSNGELELCDNSVISHETTVTESHSVAKLEMARSSSLGLDSDQSNLSLREMRNPFSAYSTFNPDQNASFSSSSFVLDLNQHTSTVQKIQELPCSSSVLNPDKKSLRFQKLQVPSCSPFVSNCDKKTLGVQKVQGPLLSSFILDPDKSISGVQKMHAPPCTSSVPDSDQTTLSTQKLQGSLPSFVVNPDQKTPSIQKLQGSPCCSLTTASVQKLQRPSCSFAFGLDPDKNTSSVEKMQEPPPSPFALDSDQNNLKFKRVVGPYIVINQDFRKATVTSTTTIIQDHVEENLNHATCMSSKDEVTITEETTSIRRNVRQVNIESRNKARGRHELLPGMTLQVRLLAILLLSILMEIPILMIICPLWK